jgi:hypothetical protein
MVGFLAEQLISSARDDIAKAKNDKLIFRRS